MTRARRRAKFFRALLLGVGILYTLCALTWMILPVFNLDIEPMPAGLMGTPLGWWPWSDSTQGISGEALYTGIVALLLGLILLAQWALLRPGAGLANRLAAYGRPLRRSVIAAAAMAMLLTAGMISLVLEMTGVWDPILNRTSDNVGYLLWAGMLVLWLLWTWVFWVYWRQGDRYTQVGKVIRALVAGSFLEAVVAVPVHIVATRQTDCYCEKGTYTTFVFAGTVLLWAFGPGIVLLYMRERYRVARVLEPCARCSYSLRGNISGVCPECGTEIERD